MRAFLIPMQPPESGKGTRQDPWYPKYLREEFAKLSEFSCRIFHDYDQALVEFDHCEEALYDILNALPDVREVNDPDEIEMIKAELQESKAAKRGTYGSQ